MADRLFVGGPFDGERMDVEHGVKLISVPIKGEPLPNGAECNTHVYRAVDFLEDDPLFVHESIQFLDALRLLMKRYPPSHFTETVLQPIAAKPHCEHYWNNDRRCTICGVSQSETA